MARGGIRLVVALAILAGACDGGRASPDGGGGQDDDADVAVDADVDGPPDGGDAGPSVADPACPEGHDRDRPSFRITAITPYLPIALGQPIVRGSLAQVIADDRLILLLITHELTPDGTAEVEIVYGERLGEDVYRRDPGSNSWLGEVFLADRSFTTDPAGMDDVLIMDEVFSVRIPLREMVLAGTFTTDERCSIGRLLPSDPPTYLEGARITGLMTLSEVLTAPPIDVGEAQLDLCDFLAGPIFEGSCADESRFLYLPDTETEEGEPAWSVELRLAAIAIVVVD